MDSNNSSASDFSSNEDEEYLPTSESSDSDSIINTTENVADRAEIVSSSASEDPQDVSSLHLGRKRRMNPAKWKHNVRKLRCNSGKEYTNQKGLTTSAKTFIRNYDCGCKIKCNSQVNESDRDLFFKSFWKLADYAKQNVFLRGLIQSTQPKVQRIRDGSRGARSRSFIYSIFVNGQNVAVTDVGSIERPSTKIDYKKIFNNRKKAGIRAKQRKAKLNAKLSKVLAPKTAQQVLQGAGVHLEFKVEAVPGGFKVEAVPGGFKAQGEWTRRIFEGTGPSKKAAKIEAADRVMAAFCVSKMVINDKNEPLNMQHVAAYAMGQLFMQWENNPTFELTNPT